MINDFIVIPSFNPDNKLITLITELIANGQSKILIINDGSKKDCLHFFDKATTLGCDVIHHAVNLGKGRGLKTAYNYLLNEYGENVLAIFADSDGQHSITDIIAVKDKLIKNEDCLILGCRQFEDKSIPFRSRFGNKITRIVFNLLCGVKVMDTQTGLRALSGKTMKKFLPTKGERFEFEMNMLIESREKSITILEVPIKTIYIEENKTSHFNPLRDSLRIYAVFMKFLISSSLSFVVDILLFASLLKLFDNMLDKSLAIFLATFGARVCSSLINYTINKNRVFNVTDKRIGTILRYYILCVIQLVCSGLLVSLFYTLLPMEESVIKIAVDFILFILSFQIQREWVFKKR
ncbi:MAG: bifunctional glycosyltransferase family 2/GtrA family protein [Oscillospiraceae bacterium]